MKIQTAASIVTASLAGLLLSACSKASGSASASSASAPVAVEGVLESRTEPQDAASAAAKDKKLTKVKVGYIGLTCEAPLYVAYEKGFFQEEGIEPELVKCEWSKYKDVLALGGYDITHHLVMYFLKPIEQGLDVKLTAGVHTGCLRVQAAIDGPIKDVKDLKGKRIGVPGMGTPPFIFANRVLGKNGMDAMKDVEWRVFPAGELGLALQKGEIDAIASAEPIGTMLMASGKIKNIADQAVDEPYKDEYCCAVIANGKWLKADPALAAAGTRAILKGAKWVQTNPKAAATMAVEKKYLASNPELNTSALGKLNYIPSVIGGQKAIESAATEMKIAGMLSPTTDVADLVKKAWQPLDGVTDKWIEDLKVEKVAGGQIPEDQDKRLYAELKAQKNPLIIATCCSKAGKAVMP